jgi:hypothetical protein
MNGLVFLALLNYLSKAEFLTELLANPCLLPNPQFLRDARMPKVLREDGGAGRGFEILEVGCLESCGTSDTRMALDGTTGGSMSVYECHSYRMTAANARGQVHESSCPGTFTMNASRRLPPRLVVQMK